MDRLFERIIGLEERLDDLEENTRKIMKNLGNTSRGSGTRPRRGKSAASDAENEA